MRLGEVVEADVHSMPRASSFLWTLVFFSSAHGEFDSDMQGL